MHANTQQALTVVETLPACVTQCGIQYEVGAAEAQCFCTRLDQQSFTNALAAQVLTGDQVINIEEAPMQQVLLQAAAGQAQHLITDPRRQQAITLLGLTLQALKEIIGVVQVRRTRIRGKQACNSSGAASQS